MTVIFRNKETGEIRRVENVQSYKQSIKPMARGIDRGLRVWELTMEDGSIECLPMEIKTPSYELVGEDA